jgi:sulfite reductase alpha subunit-like flavoprotein
VDIVPPAYFTSFSLLQDVRLIQLLAPELQYSPGDVLMVCPQNAPEKVDQFFGLLSHGSGGTLDPGAVIHIMEKDSDAPVPLALKHPLTLRKCAEQYWDLNVSMTFLFEDRRMKCIRV